MPISLQCPGCGKSYRLRDDLAGKRVKCSCGTETTVPAPGAEAAGSSNEFQLDEEPRQPVAPQTPPHAPRKDATGGASSAADGLPRRRKRRDPASEKWRIPIGLLSIGYGSVAALVILYLGLREWPAGLIGTVTRTTLAVLIAVGGVLILKRHQHGPACAGLCCVFLCFFRLWYMLILLLGALSTGQLIGFLLALILTVVLYAIPVLITVWCLKQETGKKEDPEFPS
jgi:hypothetical protein